MATIRGKFYDIDEPINAWARPIETGRRCEHCNAPLSERDPDFVTACEECYDAMAHFKHPLSRFKKYTREGDLIAARFSCKGCGRKELEFHDPGCPESLSLHDHVHRAYRPEYV